MQSHDPEHPQPPPLSEKSSHSQYPDNVSRTEDDEVSTSFSPQTGQRTKRAVGITATFLLICFVAVTDEP